MKKRSQSGFAAIESVAIIFILVVLAGVGYVVWHSHHNKANTTASSNTSTSQSASTSVPAAPQVNNASDLNSAMSALNQTNISSSNTDSSQLSSDTSGF